MVLVSIAEHFFGRNCYDLNVIKGMMLTHNQHTEIASKPFGFRFNEYAILNKQKLTVGRNAFAHSSVFTKTECLKNLGRDEGY